MAHRTLVEEAVEWDRALGVANCRNADAVVVVAARSVYNGRLALEVPEQARSGDLRATVAVAQFARVATVGLHGRVLASQARGD